MKIFTLKNNESPSVEICIPGAIWMGNSLRGGEGGVIIVPENNNDNNLIDNILAEKEKIYNINTKSLIYTEWRYICLILTM